ncbi:DUF3987 domain-containing protein [Francisella sp. LA112445]|uniref:DUF3987 domain-containing protein n=1 Tax=Francisella sp. LA112445 TaxID=1395624 RepID=UPI001788A737|nr:DUF3987 domain-containing protein [Francisella sp. LA112445]QIW10592.1 DUF3987 domain-containing protein [Francisella sp. LA112445]
MDNILELQKEVTEVKPLELPINRKELPKFNTDCLPKVIADYVEYSSNVMQQPKQYIATASLVSIAGLLGNKVCLEVNSQKAYPILWGMLIGDSGTGKTPSINEPLKFIKEIDQDNLRAYAKEFQAYSTAKDIYDIELNELKNNFKKAEKNKKESIKNEIVDFGKLSPIKPYSREIILNTATKEAFLKKISNDSPNGLLLEIDELMDFIKSLVRSEKVEDHKLYVEAYNNGEFKSETISRGMQVVDNVTVSIIGGVQTSRLLDFTKSYDGSGLLARFQLIPLAEKQLREYREPNISTLYTLPYQSMLNELNKIPQRFNIIDNERVKSEPKKYSYTKEAKSLYADWFDNNEKVKNESGQSDLMIEYLGKANNTFHALALIYHLAYKNSGNHISKEVVQKVIASLNYFYDCADYLYSDNFNKSLDLAKKIVDIKPKLKNKNGFSIGDITRSKSSFRVLGKDLVQEALDVLEQYHHIKKTNNKGTKYNKYYWLY